MSKISDTLKIDTHNVVSSEEIISILTTQMKTFIESPDIAKLLPPTFLHGAPGVGKSSIIKHVADSLGVDFIDIRLQTMESVDLRGLPVPQNDCVKWLQSAFFPRDPNSKGIILFDELSSCDRSLQVASYEIILDRKLGDYRLPPGWMIVAAGNRAEDRAVAMTTSSALSNRFLHFEVEANAEDWCNWAQTHDIIPSVIGFIKFKPNLLFRMEDENLERGWPSPRSWEKLSRMLERFADARVSDDVLQKIIYGLIGNGAGTEFYAFYKNSKNIIDILKMMTDPTEPIVIPKEIDMQYALASTMSYLVWRGKTPEDEKKRIDGFYRISMKMPEDFATLAMMSALTGNSSDKNISGACAKKLFMHPMYKSWHTAFGKNFKSGLAL